MTQRRGHKRSPVTLAKAKHVEIPIDTCTVTQLSADLGRGHYLVPVRSRDNPAEWFGILWCHPPRDGFDDHAHKECGSQYMHCESMLRFERWDHYITSTNPISLQPSLVCKLCGEHGYATDGTYESFDDRFWFFW